MTTRVGALSEREKQVLALIVRGRTNAEIAAELGIRFETAKWHVSEIITKLGVDSREEAAEAWQSDRTIGRRVARGIQAVVAPLIAHKLVIAAGAGAVVALVTGSVVAGLLRSGHQSANQSPTAVEAGSVSGLEIISGFQPRGIAFIRDGNLWVADGSGAVLHEAQVTRNGNLSYPSWSYSGDWLTVVGSGKRWLVSSKGELLPLDGKATNAAAWSPTQDILAYATADGVYLFDAASGTGSRLLDRSIDGMAWSPDGTRLAVGNDDNQPSAELAPAPAVTVITTRTGSAVSLPVAPERGPQTSVAGWTSDGQNLVVWINHILSASILADGVGLYAISLSGGPPVELGETLLYPDYISPRPGRSGTVAFIDGGGRTAWANKSLAVAQAPGSVVRLPDAAPGAIASPAWSADGSRIAYVAGPETPDYGGDNAKAVLMQRRIWVQSATGGAPTKLTDDPAYRDEHPQWGSEQCILFARLDSNDEPALWLSSGSSAPRKVTGRMSFAAAPDTTWFGYYGHIKWEATYDWWPAHDYRNGGSNAGCS